MDLTIGNDPGAFSKRAAPFLSRELFSANVISVWLDGVLGGRNASSPGDRWIVFEDEGAVVGAAMWTPPHALFLPRLPLGAARQLASELLAAGAAPAGVNGVAEATAEFAAAWSELTGASSEVHTSMRMYVLGELKAPSGVEGEARPAGPNDLELVSSWWRLFELEALGRKARDEKAAERRLAAGDLVLWLLDGEPVSLAGYSRPAAGVSRVGPVYTPPEKRGRGYGSAVTAEVSRLARRERGADHVVLYTDLANPTSNHIYRQLGYEPDHDADERLFAKAP